MKKAISTFILQTIFYVSILSAMPSMPTSPPSPPSPPTSYAPLDGGDFGATTQIQLDLDKASSKLQYIKTRIVNDTSALNIALSKTSDYNGTKTISPAIISTDAQVLYKLHDEETDSDITTFKKENISSTSEAHYPLLTLSGGFTKAYKKVSIQFRYCEDQTTGAISNYLHCEPIEQSGYKIVDSKSSDMFAIRPDSFLLSKPQTYFKSAKFYNLELSALDKNSTNKSQHYNISSANTILNFETTKFKPDMSIDNTLNGTLTLSSIPFNITDGYADDLNLTFDDIGLINIKVTDKHWADIDINDSNENERWFYGDINLSFIPDHFEFTSATIKNHNNSVYTYMSNDLNMSAKIELELKAKNNENNTVLNFDKNSWENPVNITFNISTPNIPSIIKQEIDKNSSLGFIDGTLNIPWNESSSLKQLRFNTQRVKNIPLNPFKIYGSDIVLNATSAYGSTTISGTVTPSLNATLLYAKTYAPRQQILGNEGNVKAFYEVFCSSTDFFHRICVKSFLPNGSNSTILDDPKWFINNYHTSEFGITGDVTQNSTIQKVTPISQTNDNHITYIKLKLDTKTNRPYTTTMKNKASSWLIFNKLNATAQENKFIVEFVGSTSSNVGLHETNTSIKSSANKYNTRRTMW